MQQLRLRNHSINTLARSGEGWDESLPEFDDDDTAEATARSLETASASIGEMGGGGASGGASGGRGGSGRGRGRGKGKGKAKGKGPLRADTNPQAGSDRSAANMYVWTVL